MNIKIVFLLSFDVLVFALLVVLYYFFVQSPSCLYNYYR